MAVAFLAVTLAICSCRKEERSTSLIEAWASAPERPSRLRIASFPYAPPPRVKRGSAQSGTSLHAAAYAVLASPPSGDSVRIRSAAYLALGRAAEAAKILKQELASRASEPLLWNDYAAALYETAIRDDEPRTLPSALAATDRAIALSPRLAEAVCNRALILETMQLRQAAIDAWTRCVDIEADARWRDEGRAHLATLQTPTSRERWNDGTVLRRAVAENRMLETERLVRDFRQDSRTWCEGQVLGEWADSWLAGERLNAGQSLKIARVVGELLGEERLLRDAVLAIDRAVAVGDADGLARAHVTYRSARIAISRRRPSEAIEPLLAAERVFRRYGSPMELVARYYRAGATFDTDQAESALLLLTDVETRLQPAYNALRAQILWERSRIVGRSGDIYQGLDLGRRATELFDRLQERVHAARMRMVMATAFTLLGRPREAWQLRQEIFRVISDSGPPDELERALHNLALSELADERLEEAAALLQVQLSSSSKLPLLQFEARLWSTWIATRAGEKGTAEAQLAALRAAAHALSEASQRESALEDLRFANALLLRERDPSEAVRLLSETIASRNRTGRMHDLPDAHVQRALGERQIGDVDAAIRDFDAALTILERRRLTVHRADLRDSFFASAETACRELLRLYLRGGKTVAAFDTAERCRARGLVDAVTYSGITPHTVSTDELRRRLGPGTTLVHYTTFADQTIAFVVSRQGIRHFVLQAGTQVLERAAAEKSARLPELYRALIAPLADELRETATLLVVPDEGVAGVPFGALHDGNPARPLIRAMRVVIAPSASYYAAALDLQRHSPAREAFIVGDPAFDRNLFTNERLPGAANEARMIGTMYRRPTVITGSDASVDRVLQGLAECDVAHIATHALVSSRDASLSALLMAPTASASGSLYPAQIASLHLDRAPLVVLAGCRTAATGPGRGSIRGFAFSFLSAGSRGVIATLWDVDDAHTVAFSRALHQRIQKGQPAADALRDSQLEMLDSPDPELRRPEIWGAFQLYGAR